jgi:hypothetical protein
VRFSVDLKQSFPYIPEWKAFSFKNKYIIVKGTLSERLGRKAIGAKVKVELCQPSYQMRGYKFGYSMIIE